MLYVSYFATPSSPPAAPAAAFVHGYIILGGIKEPRSAADIRALIKTIQESENCTKVIPLWWKEL